jgi:hypothetical protein
MPPHPEQNVTGWDNAEILEEVKGWDGREWLDAIGQAWLCGNIYEEHPGRYMHDRREIEDPTIYSVVGNERRRTRQRPASNTGVWGECGGL